MFGFRKNKKPHRIESISDFADPRAKAIATAHDLSPSEIFPAYRDLEAQIQAGNGEIEVDLMVPQNETARKLACGAIVCYELASREAVQFSDDGRIATIRRSVPAKVYASLGRYYEGLANNLFE